MRDETWDTIAEWYTQHVVGSAMHDFARDTLLAALPPDLTGLNVLDLGCGEGTITRALAARGATAVGIDPAARMIAHARSTEDAAPAGVAYTIDDGCTLATVASESLDWVTAGLSLNNVPDLDAAIASARRVLLPHGRFAFTIPHPCFEAPHAGWTTADNGTNRRVIGDYLNEGFWRSTNPDDVRRVGNQHRILSSYLMALRHRRFTIEFITEPAPDDRLAAEQPQRAGLPPFVLIRAHRH